mgnify:CR=1 FL=1
MTLTGCVGVREPRERLERLFQKTSQSVRPRRAPHQGAGGGACMACRGGPGPGGERWGAKFQKSMLQPVRQSLQLAINNTVFAAGTIHGPALSTRPKCASASMADARAVLACGGGRGPTGCARWYSTLVSMRSRLHFFPPVHQSVCVSQALVGVPRLASPPDWPPSVDLERCPVQRAKGSERVLPAWDRLRVRVRVRGQGQG